MVLADIAAASAGAIKILFFFQNKYPFNYVYL